MREHKERMRFSCSVSCKKECLSFHLIRTCLSLLKFSVWLFCLSTAVCAQLSHVTHDHLLGSRSYCLFEKNVSSPCVTHDVARAFIFISLHPHERSTFVSLSLNPRDQLLKSRYRSINTALIHRMSMDLWSTLPSLSDVVVATCHARARC